MAKNLGTITIDQRMCLRGFVVVTGVNGGFQHGIDDASKCNRLEFVINYSARSDLIQDTTWSGASLFSGRGKGCHLNMTQFNYWTE